MFAAHCKMQRYGKSLRIKNNLRKTLFYSQFFLYFCSQICKIIAI